MTTKNSTEKEAPHTKEQLGYDPKNLVYYQIAQKFFSEGTEEGFHLAGKTLESFMKKTGSPHPELITTIKNDPSMLQKAIQGALISYETYRSKQTIEGILADSSLKGNFGKRAEGIGEFLKPYHGKKLEEIKEKAKEVDYLSKGEKYGVVSKEKAESAKKEYEKYSNVLSMISIIESQEMEKIKKEIRESYVNEIVDSILSLKEKPEEKEFKLKKAA